MALHGSTTYIKIIKDPDGTPIDMTGKAIFDELSPTVSTDTATKTGIGGFTKKRISAHSYSISVSGAVTSYDLLDAIITPDSVFDIQVHDRAFEDAVAKSLNISCEDGDILQFSADFEAKSIATITALDTMPDPGSFFVMSDATISFDGSSNSVTKFELNAERDVTPVYGGNVDPTDFSKSSFKYSGTITLSPASSVGDIELGARLPSDSTFTFTATFKDDPTLPTVIIKLTTTGMLANEASMTLNADSPVEIPVKFESTSLTIANTE